MPMTVLCLCLCCACALVGALAIRSRVIAVSPEQVVEASTEADRFRNTTVALSPGRAFENTEDDATDWALAVTNCLFAYNGWNNLNLSAGEVKNAGVTIPQATMISIPLITVCYIWVNASYMLALPTEAISSGKTIAVDFAREIGGTVAGDAMAVAVACSAFGALNGSIFGAARLLHACGTDGTLPRIFGTTVSFCRAPTPLVATVVQATIASILIAAIGSFTVIVKIYIFAQWFFYLVTMIGLLRLRVTEPMLHRPFKVLLPVPVAFIVAASFVVGVLLWQSPSECGIGLAVLLAGTPVYFLQRDPKATLQGQFDGHLVAEAAPLLSGVSKRTDADPDDYYDGAESGRSTPAAAGTTSIWASCCFWFAASDLNAGSSAGEAGEAAGGNLYRPDAEFDSDGVKIRYFDTGTGSLGETAMLIHGWSSSSRMWMESAPFTVRIVGPLVDAGFRVIGMDIRGHGLSDKPRNVSDYGLNMVEDHVRFLDHLGIAGAVHVAGAAMGAEIAIKLATMHPGLVKSLCPVGTGWSAGTDWFEKSYGYMTNPCTSEGFCLATACGYHTCCCPCAMQMMLGEVPDRRAVLAAGRSMESVIDVDESDLRALRVPVHGIVGEKDEERRYVERMRGVVPDFTMAIIPGKGHDASFTDPLWHSETVDFFKRVVVLPRRKRGNSTVSQSGGSQSEQPE